PCSPLPPACTAEAKAATSRSAGFRSPSQSSGSLGKPIHTASCGAHSGRGGATDGVMTARVEDRSPAAKIGPCATLPQLHYVTAEKGGIMKSRAVLVGWALGLSCISAPASAEPPIGSRLGERLTKNRPGDEVTSVQQAHALVTCLTNKRAPMAKRLL